MERERRGVSYSNRQRKTSDTQTSPHQTPPIVSIPKHNRHQNLLFFPVSAFVPIFKPPAPLYLQSAQKPPSLSLNPKHIIKLKFETFFVSPYKTRVYRDLKMCPLLLLLGSASHGLSPLLLQFHGNWFLPKRFKDNGNAVEDCHPFEH
ncbi:uncharacterized protein LOC110011031 [Jatropha curcas]|uniref:uncharacterized protein LOC110011031 n=1 Tax=Jatropha curcas TaxID=180498 RepID=UPI00189494A6|nr:uncharacterized protein LOC110011031 [Jatropha curcas]